MNGRVWVAGAVMSVALAGGVTPLSSAEIEHRTDYSIRLSGLPCTVKPVTSAQYKEMNPKSADRPAWSALENRALRCSVGDDMRDWKDAIQDFFNNWDGK